MSDETAQLTTRVPKQLRTDINIISKRKGTTVTAIVIEVLEKYAEENKEYL